MEISVIVLDTVIPQMVFAYVGSPGYTPVDIRPDICLAECRVSGAETFSLLIHVCVSCDDFETRS